MFDLMKRLVMKRLKAKRKVKRLVARSFSMEHSSGHAAGGGREGEGGDNLGLREGNWGSRTLFSFVLTRDFCLRMGLDDMWTFIKSFVKREDGNTAQDRPESAPVSAQFALVSDALALVAPVRLSCFARCYCRFRSLKVKTKLNLQTRRITRRSKQMQRTRLERNLFSSIKLRRSWPPGI